MVCLFPAPQNGGENPRGSRKKLIEKYGYDIKFAYHVVRLINEAEQILEHGDIDLERDREMLKSIRRGEWTQEEIRAWFSDKEKLTSKLYQESDLRHTPDEGRIKQLLLDCLEEHYGNLGNAIYTQDKYLKAIKQIKNILESI